MQDILDTGSQQASSDNQLLDQMRSLMQEFVLLCSQSKLPAAKCESFRHEFDALRNNLHDNMLKEFSSFELMEKICKLEKSKEN